MKNVALLMLACVACAPETARRFPVGVIAGSSAARTAAEARRLGFDVADAAPPAAAVLSASDEAQRTMPAAHLRFLAAGAALSEAAGVYFLPPRLPAGVEWPDYAEEWLSAMRVLREVRAVRPIIESGQAIKVPVVVPVGVLSRAWRHQGRDYVLLINSSGLEAPLDSASLQPWRALFKARSDGREALSACARGGACLQPEGVLWLEGRLLPGTAR